MRQMYRLKPWASEQRSLCLQLRLEGNSAEADVIASQMIDRQIAEGGYYELVESSLRKE